MSEYREVTVRVLLKDWGWEEAENLASALNSVLDRYDHIQESRIHTDVITREDAAAIYDLSREDWCNRCAGDECNADCDEEGCKCSNCPDDGGECEHCGDFYKGSIALSEHEEECPDNPDNQDEEDEEEEVG